MSILESYDDFFINERKQILVGENLYDKKSMKKSVMLSPDKLFSFVGYTPKKSHEIMCDIMNKYILIDNNVCDVYHEENDLILFNNRKVIKSTVPIGEIDGEFVYSYLSLDTNEKYTSCLYT